MELKAENLIRMFWVIAIVQGKIGGLLIDPAYLWNCNFSSKSCAENNSSFTNHCSHRTVWHREIECHSILARHAGVNNMLRLGFLPVLNFWNEWNNLKKIFHEQNQVLLPESSADAPVGICKKTFPLGKGWFWVNVSLHQTTMSKLEKQMQQPLNHHLSTLFHILRIKHNL